MRSLSIIACLASLLLACGSSKPAQDPADQATPVVSDAKAEETPVESPEEKFARQQTDTINKMCQRLIDCSIEDAKKQMTPEKYAQLDVAKIKPAAIADCTQNADQSPLSPRQVIGIRQCLGEPSECSVFTDCIGAAGKTE